jgi:general stress protein YciG
MAKRKNPAAVALGRRRMKLISAEERAELGHEGGKARLTKLTPEKRQEIARKAGKASAAARWGTKAD